MEDSNLYTLLDDALDLLPEAWDDPSSVDAPASPPVTQPKSSGASALLERYSYPQPSEGTTPSAANLWDPRLVIDLAVGVESIEEILPRYNLHMEAFERLLKNTAFRQELALTIREVKEKGLTFMRKARVQAEAYLEIMDDLVYNEMTPAATRLETIKSAVRWAGLEEQTSKDDQSNTNQVVVNISF